MEKNFGISDDKTVSISVDKNADTSQISKKLREITADVNQCIVKDYSQQIEAAEFIPGTENVLLLWNFCGSYGN